MKRSKKEILMALLNKLLFWWYKHKFQLISAYLGWFILFQYNGFNIEESPQHVPFLLTGLSFAIVGFSYGCIWIINTLLKIKWKPVIQFIKCLMV